MQNRNCYSFHQNSLVRYIKQNFFSSDTLKYIYYPYKANTGTLTFKHSFY